MEKKFLKKIMFTIEEGNDVISSCIICFASVRKNSDEMLRRLTFIYFEKVSEFSTPSFFTE